MGYGHIGRATVACVALGLAFAACGRPVGVARPTDAGASTSVDVDLPEAPTLAGAVPEPSAPSPTAIDPMQLHIGRAVYARFCALCHGPTAEGYAADNAPSLVSQTFLESASDAFLHASIARGRPGTAMAGYGAEIGGPLAGQQIDAIVALLRSRGVAPLHVPPRPAAGNPAAGELLYNAKCVECHGTVAQRMNAVHLFNPQLLASADDGFLRHAIERGRPGTRMLPFVGVLSPEQIDAILAYLRKAAPPLPERPSPWMPPSDATPLAQPATATEPGMPPGMPATPRPTGPVVLHPHGKAPVFKLRDERYAPIDAVAKALKDKRRLIVLDARAPSDFDMMHITGSIVTPYYDKKSLDVVPNDGTWVIAYCACPHHASGEVVDELKRRGHKNVAVLDEGVFAWNAKGYPVVKSPSAPQFAAPPPLPDPHAGHGHAHPGHGEPGHRPH